MSQPLATFPMYDWPEVSDDWDTFWTLVTKQLVAAGIDAPSHLSRANDPFALWKNPGLMIGQTCGWPYANLLDDHVTAIARFDHGLAHAPAGHYYSLLVAHADETETLLSILQADSMIAVNGLDSQSGFRVLREFDEAFVADPPNARIKISGSHRQSLKLVAAGDASLAAIDAVSFEMARRFEPEAVSAVAVIGTTLPKPSLPLVTAKKNSQMADQLFIALASSVETMSPELCDALNIYGVLPADRDVYQVFKEHHLNTGDGRSA